MKEIALKFKLDPKYFLEDTLEKCSNNWNTIFYYDIKDLIPLKLRLLIWGYILSDFILKYPNIPIVQDTGKEYLDVVMSSVYYGEGKCTLEDVQSKIRVICNKFPERNYLEIVILGYSHNLPEDILFFKEPANCVKKTYYPNYDKELADYLISNNALDVFKILNPLIIHILNN